jgi:hypothetical protein
MPIEGTLAEVDSLTSSEDICYAEIAVKKRKESTEVAFKSYC